MDKHPLKKYPIVGACGLSCGLCPAYNRTSESRCPGCCGPDFMEKHPGCAIITCCVKQKGLETCAQCPDWTGCGKIGRRLEFSKLHDSFVSYRLLFDRFALIQKIGFEEFVRFEVEKQEYLRYLIQHYDDGRSKSFFCTSAQLVPLGKLKEAVADAETQIAAGIDLKEKTRIVREEIGNLADSLQIDLRLRK